MLTDDAAFPFWRFSLALYGRPGVPELCVGLQDTHGVDVNVLFCLLHRARAGAALEAAEIARLDAAVAPWRSGVVQPLRQARRALKSAEMAALANDGEALRNRVKAAEMQAEKHQQRALERIGAGLGRDGGADPDSATRAVWAAYAAHLGRDLPGDALERLLTALAEVEAEAASGSRTGTGADQKPATDTVTGRPS